MAEPDDLRAEYNFSKMSGGVRNKYADRLSGDVVFVSLDPDVAKAFPSGAAVNQALRAVIKAAKPPRKAKVRAKSSLRRSAA